jgi:hypothetical protein
MGWVEALPNSSKFHVKFDVSDLDEKVKPHQYYNHFSDNREITTKAGICKNLWTLCSHEASLGVGKFFPRCYDLSDHKQADSFVADFNSTAIRSILKIYADEFLRQDPYLEEMLMEYSTKKSTFAQPRVYKAWFKKAIEQDCVVGSQQSQLVMQAYQMIKVQRKLASQESKLSAGTIQKLVAFHQNLISGAEDLHLESFTTLQKLKILKIDKLEQSIDGTQNVWVVKPSYTARGLGIYCANKVKDIIQVGKNAKQKVVQKYIESPLLISKHKFDLR